MALAADLVAEQDPPLGPEELVVASAAGAGDRIAVMTTNIWNTHRPFGLRDRYPVVVYVHASGQGWHELSVDEVCGPLGLGLLSGGEVVVLDHPRPGDGGRDGEFEARVIDRDGRLRSAFGVGRGVRVAAIGDDDDVWVGYEVGRSGRSSRGPLLVRYSRDGQVRGDYQQPAGVGPIGACQALNAAGDVWALCTSEAATGEPPVLVRVVGDVVTAHRPALPPGALRYVPAFAVGDRVLLVSGEVVPGQRWRRTGGLTLCRVDDAGAPPRQALRVDAGDAWGPLDSWAVIAGRGPRLYLASPAGHQFERFHVVDIGGRHHPVR